MYTTLPKRSWHIRNKLKWIVKECLGVGEKKIAMIILYGSYARGDWVGDMYEENGSTYSYQSDIDLLLILNGNYSKHQINKLEDKIEKRLEFLTPTLIDMMTKPSPSVILESIVRFNKELEKGKYFFCDIVKEGTILYDSGKCQLAEPADLPWKRRKPIAQEEYDYWFERGKGFLFGVRAYLEIGDYALSAFSLHQATESFYNTILLVFSGYKPKEHDILKLGKKSKIYSNELLKIFPMEPEEKKECFVLLQKAYVDARYNKNYKITKEQLLYLIERVEMLKDVTMKICSEKLAS